jgi:hypothetical protein
MCNADANQGSITACTQPDMHHIPPALRRCAQAHVTTAKQAPLLYQGSLLPVTYVIACTGATHACLLSAGLSFRAAAADGIIMSRGNLGLDFEAEVSCALLVATLPRGLPPRLLCSIAVLIQRLCLLQGCICTCMWSWAGTLLEWQVHAVC